MKPFIVIIIIRLRLNAHCLLASHYKHLHKQSYKQPLHHHHTNLFINHASSNLLLNSSIISEHTTPSDRLFHKPVTLNEKLNFLMSLCACKTTSLKEFPLVLLVSINLRAEKYRKIFHFDRAIYKIKLCK